MWVCYLDESGIDDRSRVVVVAGYMATALTWARFEYAWSALLRDFGVDVFHNRTIYRDHFALWSSPQRARFWEAVLEVIDGHDLYGVATGVISADYRACMDAAVDQHSKLCKRQREHPYFFSFQYVLIEAVERANLQSPEHLLFVCDQHPSYQAGARQIHSGLRGLTAWEHSGRLGSLEFRSKNACPALQVADLLVSKIRRDLERHMFHPSQSEDPFTARLKRRSLFLQYHDRASIGSKISKSWLVPVHRKRAGA